MPAASLPMPPTPRIVPLVNTPDRMSLTASATFSSSVCLQLGLKLVVLPSRSVIAVIAMGSQYLPRAAKVA